MTHLGWSYIGQLDYIDTVGRLEARRSRILDDETDLGEVFLCSHPPTITLGRHAQKSNIRLTRDRLQAQGVSIEPSTRGGDVTYHGPEQLMIYPVVRVRGLRTYVRDLAEAVIETLGKLGVPDCRWFDDPAGVWTGGRKIAACGLHLHRHVAIHGFALNLATPATAWSAIVPCGLSSRPVSVADLLGTAPDPAEAAEIAGPIVARTLARSIPAGRWPARDEAVWSLPRGSIER